MSNNKIFVISDTHFGHTNVLKFEPKYRPFDSIKTHDRELVLRWNSVVKPEDTVWHLGDVYFGGRHNHWILAHLNGIKKLVMGNHDHYPIDCYTRYFARVYGAATIDRIILTHVPVHPSQLMYRYALNVHGHLHSNRVLDAYHKADARYVCASVEHTGLFPVPLREFISSQTAIS